MKYDNVLETKRDQESQGDVIHQEHRPTDSRITPDAGETFLRQGPEDGKDLTTEGPT